MIPDEFECPIKDDLEEFHRKSSDFIKAIRKIRRQMTRCKSCQALAPGCPYRAQFNQAVDQAIKEINLELRMS